MDKTSGIFVRKKRIEKNVVRKREMKWFMVLGLCLCRKWLRNRICKEW